MANSIPGLTHRPRTTALCALSPLAIRAPPLYATRAPSPHATRAPSPHATRAPSPHATCAPAPHATHALSPRTTHAPSPHATRARPFPSHESRSTRNTPLYSPEPLPRPHPPLPPCTENHSEDTSDHSPLRAHVSDRKAATRPTKSSAPFAPPATTMNHSRSRPAPSASAVSAIMSSTVTLLTPGTKPTPPLPNATEQPSMRKTVASSAANGRRTKDVTTSMMPSTSVQAVELPPTERSVALVLRNR
ncbi:hypothetical protein PAXINDRAFT_22109 [Paxillus involutus ATCC 200175]|uniref:Uncharacterized protein n=1 Tax=Paxillus involutus ATCC 200175 TaxID=664439 RepID=A0A0C9SZN0_PAXIN|nr:hypothetical protein PAXINDRAFT_22109 [Paxillus involutus ATCC 200175]